MRKNATSRALAPCSVLGTAKQISSVYPDLRETLLHLRLVSRRLSKLPEGVGLQSIYVPA